MDKDSTQNQRRSSTGPRSRSSTSTTSAVPTGLRDSSPATSGPSPLTASGRADATEWAPTQIQSLLGTARDSLNFSKPDLAATASSKRVQRLSGSVGGGPELETT